MKVEKIRLEIYLSFVFLLQSELVSLVHSLLKKTFSVFSFHFCIPLKISCVHEESFLVMKLSRTEEANSPKLNRPCFRP